MINVVGQGVMGLTLACARCHEHKFDPITTEDYYALAGIFFSTSLVHDIPNNPGNTPLVRVELLTKGERQRLDEQIAANRKHVEQLDQQISEISARLSSFEVAGITWGRAGTTFHRNGVSVGTNKGIDSISSDPQIRALMIGEAGSGKVAKFRGLLAELRVYDRQLEGVERSAVEAQLFGHWFTREAQEGLSEKIGFLKSTGEVLRFVADDPGIQLSDDNRVTVWPDRAGQQENAVSLPSTPEPQRTEVMINRQSRPILAFTGVESLHAPLHAPTAGSMFLVFARTGRAIASKS
jgi:hypothetical protein